MVSKTRQWPRHLGVVILGQHFRHLFTAAFGTLVCVILVIGWATPTIVDFLNLYGAGKAVSQGQIASIYDSTYFWPLQESITGSAGHSSMYRFLYLPVYAFLFRPLSLMPYVVSRLVFGILSLLCIARVLCLGRQLSGLHWMDSALLVLVCGSFYVALLLGQLSVFLLFIVTALTIRSLEGRNVFSTGLLAGALIVKPNLLLPLGVAWLVTRKWRALLGMASMAVAAVVASFLVSPSALLAYVQANPANVASAVGHLNPRHVNATAYGLLATVLPSPAAEFASVGVGVMVLLLIALSYRRGATRFHYAALWAALPLTSPWLGYYDCLLLLVPVWLLAPMWRDDLLAVLACTLLWAGLAAMVVSDAPITVVVDVVFFGCCIWRAFRVRPTARVAEIHAAPSPG